MTQYLNRSQKLACTRIRTLLQEKLQRLRSDVGAKSINGHRNACETEFVLIPRTLVMNLFTDEFYVVILTIEAMIHVILNER